MKNKNRHIEDINEIRRLMEHSSKFISLSGLSGISAGIIALAGAGIAYFYMNFNMRYFNSELYFNPGSLIRPNHIHKINMLMLAAVILIMAIASAVFFTIRKVKKNKMPIWSKTTQRLLLNMSIPLVAGGIFCLVLFYHGIIFLLAPATLIFYGLALLNASKYTLHEIRYLGVTEIILGIISSIFIGYGLISWALGFGVMHIIYGAFMYFKYDAVKNR